MRLNSYKILFLLPFTLGYDIYAENSEWNKDDVEYSNTHAFSKEENVKEFNESLNKVKDYLLRKSIQDENKSIKKKEEDFETLTTLIKDIFEQSSFGKETAEKDVLFNNYFIEQALLTRDHKGKAILDSFLEDNETISEELVSCVNLFTRNNWHSRADNLRRLELYEEEEGARNIKKINDLYKTFKEDEYELIKLFSSEPAKDRYGINDYNWFIDFTKGNLPRKTGLFKVKFLEPLIIIISVVLIYLSKKILPILGPKLTPIANKIKNLPILGQILTPIISKIISADQNNISFSITNFFNTHPLWSILIIVCYLFRMDRLFLRPVNFNSKLFKKFHIISRYIKRAHSIYNICKENKHLQIFLYNDLVNLSKFFETEDKDLKDLINTAINISPYRINILRVANFILRFDNSRDKFHDIIFDFLIFKKYINALQMKNNNNNMSSKWSIPAFINENKSIKFKNLYNIALRKGEIPTDIYFDKNNRGLFFSTTNDYNEKKLQQALMLCFICINGYGICPCEKAEICMPEYIHYTPDIFTDTNINNNNLEKWINVATIYFERTSNIKKFYIKRCKGSNTTFFNIMNEVQDNGMKSNRFVNIVLNVLKDESSFLYLINHNKDVHEIKNKYPKLPCANKYIEEDEDKNEIVNDRYRANT